jgi:hypothetical protein
MLFDIETKVRFCRTSSKDLDGLEGTVIGVAVDFGNYAHYIVLLDKSYLNQRGIQITSHCLEKVKKQI